MFGLSKEIAIPIPLKVWQDPQGNPLLIYSEHNCEVYFGCWDKTGEPAEFICRISFDSAWASKSCGLEFLRYQINEHTRSSILEIENSKWLKELTEYRLKCYPEWKTWDKTTYHHFVIQGHDEFVEILAKSYKEESISIEDAKNLLPSVYLEYLIQ